MAGRRAAMRKMAHVISEQHEEKILRQIAKQQGIGFLSCGCEDKHLVVEYDCECGCEGGRDVYCGRCFQRFW